MKGPRKKLLINMSKMQTHSIQTYKYQYHNQSPPQKNQVEKFAIHIIGNGLIFLVYIQILFSHSEFTT